MDKQQRSGVLKWDQSSNETTSLFISVARPNGKPHPRYLSGREVLSDSLKDRGNDQLDGLEVDFIWSKGKVLKVRPKGEALEKKAPRIAGDSFVNPYTFLPATPRDEAPASLADNAPVGHDRLREDHWTGQLPVQLRVVTPLLLLDPSRAEPADDGPNSHTTYPMLRRNGQPYLPATSVKGMLRAAYEAVTNSRLSVFTGHDERLGQRMRPTDSQHMVPARINTDGTEIELLPGDTAPGGQRANNPLLHAAWLPAYDKDQVKETTDKGKRNRNRQPPPVTYPDGKIPGHGDEVWARVELLQHHRNSTGSQPDFTLWRVRALARAEAELPETDAPAPEGSGRYQPCEPRRLKTVHGWVCRTNENISKKHDERVFFIGEQRSETHPLTNELREQWAGTIRDYRAAHRYADIWQRRKEDSDDFADPDEYLGPEPGRPAWSPHQYDTRFDPPLAGSLQQEEENFRPAPGTLCYAYMDGVRVQGLYPVMISRSLHQLAPEALLHDSLKPARSLDQLSPADRVFGWVNAAGPGAYRGQLRLGPIEPVEVTTDDFDAAGVPLAILGAPKPQQARFYVGKGPDGMRPPRPDKDDKAGYARPLALRGRKGYWHHRDLPEGYWDNPTEDRTQQHDHSKRAQEYRRPDGKDGPQRDTQNRSVRGWIRPGSTFRFTVSVSNLSPVELGALLWVLELPAEHHHRLGHGKPLGFGSVRLELDAEGCDLRTGKEWREAYRSLVPEPEGYPGDSAALKAALERARHAFEEAAAALSRGPDAPHLEAFLAVTAGVQGAAVHYPRTKANHLPDNEPPKPDPEGNSYAWFTANEKVSGRKTESGRGLSLPHWTSPQLPFHPEK